MLLFVIDGKFKHPFYINPLELHIPYFDTIIFDDHFIVEQSETSDNRPYSSTNGTLESRLLLEDPNTQLDDQTQFLLQGSSILQKEPRHQDSQITQQ